MASSTRQLSCADYHVAWICPLVDVELLPARLMLDEEHSTPTYNTHYDENTYICGTIYGHTVVIATCPQGETSNVNAGRLTGPMFKTFPNIRIAVLVGIGGGIPYSVPPKDPLNDIHLGDVVIGWPGDRKPACYYYDYGRSMVDGQFTIIEMMQSPDWRVTNALGVLMSDYELGRTTFDSQRARLRGHKQFACPGRGHDQLFEASYHHVGDYKSNCKECNRNKLIQRPQRSEDDRHKLIFHRGRIATGNSVIQDGELRDWISARCDQALCVETEAAGVNVNRRCLIIRGISDYADSHTNGVWKPYAAGNAAAFTRELLHRIQPNTVKEIKVTTKDSVTLSDDERECLRSLSFPEQENRYNSIYTAKGTCHWLLEDSQYQAWINKPRGLLWIKGNPGTGKSVLMKFAATIMDSKNSRELVLTFFIHGQGTDLQRTPLGVFRALLNSMLKSFPVYLAKLTQKYKTRQDERGSYLEKRWYWADNELKEFMSEVLIKGSNNQPMIIYVDALDECGKELAKNLLTYFKDLMKWIRKEKANVKICFSSRHYPILGLSTIPTILVEKQNNKDIQLVVHERLEEIRLNEECYQLEKDIVKKAQGGFQWAVLVTDRMIDEYATGTGVRTPHEKLASIPEALDELYTNILSNVTADEHIQIISLFQWILFAKRPLSTQELRAAVAADNDRVFMISKPKCRNNWPENYNQFEKYVKNISRGLVEFQTRDLWERHNGEDWDKEAQFIHQSVAEYLAKDIHNDFQHDRCVFRFQVGVGHFEISRSCLS